ncbi:MAG: hypothetical protein IH845_01660 [Nanoarchaeota archaeon]|nr:hypothetical protein [Nanoarchaeota archaeon]
MNINKTKTIVGFELITIIMSLFSFSYIIELQSSYFEENVDDEENGILNKAITFVMKKIMDPIIPLVSASGHFSLEVTGCCKTSVDNEICSVVSRDSCEEGAEFQEGVLCEESAFCQRGCCFDESIGSFYPHVIETSCKDSWVANPTCDLPAADLGCCFLGTTSRFSTYGECKIDTENWALSNNAAVDWDGSISEFVCAIKGAFPTEGACILFDESCSIATIGDCFDSGGQFNEGYLCTAKVLNTVCEKTEETTCVAGKDGVYFVDSCGNAANIYDASKVNDQRYWEKIIFIDESCGYTNSNGNGGSLTCGNCDRFKGGICRDAFKDEINPEYGDNYCKPTECIVTNEFGTITYETGESWCDYQGKIGEGDDVVGSLHWINICNQGVVDTTNCGDYRNGICVQKNTFELGDTEVAFRGAGCATNNGDSCLALNQDEDGIEECEETLNCYIRHIEVSEFFQFDVCVPKYPRGFNVKSERSQAAATEICGFASLECEVVRELDFFGSCGIVANKECLTDKFAEEMNELCRGMGDCGADVNIAGRITENYKVYEDGERLFLRLGSVYKNSVRALSRNINGQVAEVEDYTPYLRAVGLGVDFDDIDVGSSRIDDEFLAQGGINFAAAGGAYGLAATYSAGYAAFVAGGDIVVPLSIAYQAELAGTSAVSSAGAAAFAAPAIGAAAGFIIGVLIADSLGLPGIAGIQMGVGAALIGAVAGYAAYIAYIGTAATIPVFGWIAAALGAILIGLSFLWGESCKNSDVKFTCEPWIPPTGGDDCELCNEDPNKPCTLYQCNSLGSACDLINRGSSEEACISDKDDGFAPTATPAVGNLFDGTKIESTNNGFRITDTDGGCLPANTPINIPITTNEEAICKYSLEQIEFEDMENFGSRFYTLEHSLVVPLPDPSHGRSQGLEFSEEFTIYIKCEDIFGHIGPVGSRYLTVDLCVDQGRDFTVPEVTGTSPGNGFSLGYDTNETDFLVTTNELSTCKWSKTDVRYSEMENEMECNDLIFRPSNPTGYLCSDILPLNEPINTYYIKCMDQPWLEVSDFESRNAMRESFIYTLKRPEEKIVIDYILPDREIITATDFTSFEIEIGTNAGGELHRCSYSISGFETMVPLFETGTSRTHIQTGLSRPVGNYHIYVECLDVLSGDTVQGETEFKITKDTTSPQIARIFQDENVLTVVTNEDAICKYMTTSCRYNFEDGIDIGSFRTHTITVTRGDSYYIKCKDEFENVPSSCSIIVRAV